MTKSPSPRFGNGQPARVPPDDSRGDRYIFITAPPPPPPPQCKQCGSTNLNIYKTMPREADGSIRRYARCGDCLACYIIVSEVSEVAEE